MRVVFISGPYRNSSEWRVEQNIRQAEKLALAAWELGVAVHCPHKNTARLGGALPDEVWLKGDLEVLSRCDAVLCTSDWRQSVGATAEVELARQLGLPVFEAIEELNAWLLSQK